MPAPATYEYAVDTLEAAHQAVLDLIDAGTGAGKVRLYDESDTLLCDIPLTDPAGTINVSTGQLTLTGGGAGTASADGECTYGTICDSDNNVIMTLPAQDGGSAVSGKITIGDATIATGAEVEVASIVIG